MLRYIFIRIIWMIIILFSFLSILFITIRLIQQFAILRYNTNDYYFKDVAGPIVYQYLDWIKDFFVKWDWGVSTRVRVNVPVYKILLPKLPVTIRINLISFLIYTPIGFILGIIAAIKKNKMSDNYISLLTIIFMSIPSFVFMLLIILLFAYQLNWLPSQYPPSDVVGDIQYTSLVLPLIALSVGPIAELTRLIRGEVTEALSNDYILLARTKGLTTRQSVIRHAVRNSMVPIIPTLMVYIVGILSGSVVIEMIYSIPGAGRLFIQALAIDNFDYNLIMALSAFYTSIGLFSMLLVDLSYGIVDPRIRMGSKK